jgi:predicted CXXCH cytochrome family protein
MGRGWRAAWAASVAAAALLLFASVARPEERGEVCELSRVDRARTPSLRCVACHDGATAIGVTIGPAGGGHGDHPVEVDYGSIAAQRPGRYVPLARLPADVPLVDGKVTCTSCHDGASRHAGRVALGGHRLCLACHDL